MIFHSYVSLPEGMFFSFPTPPGRHLTSGGSSGGAASAVATFLAPVAVSEARPPVDRVQVP